MSYVVYHEDDRIEKYLSELAKRIFPLIKGADEHKIAETLRRVNEVRGFYTLLPQEAYLSERNSLTLASDEHNFLKKITEMSDELLKLIRGDYGESWQREASVFAGERFSSGLKSFQAAKKHPLSSLPNPERYDLKNITDKDWERQLRLEVDLDVEAKKLDRVPELNEIEDALRAISVAADFIISKSLKNKGRPKLPPSEYLLRAVSELDLCFKEYFPELKGRKNGTPYQAVAYEILCEEFFGSNRKERIKVAINHLSSNSSIKTVKFPESIDEISLRFSFKFSTS